MTEKKIPLGGLNTDDSYVVMPAGDYQSAQNISVLVAANGKVAAIKNIVGNRHFPIEGVDDPYQEGFDTVGSFEEQEKGRVYYFITQGGNSNYIIMYDYINDTYKFVLVGGSALLGFTGDPITGIDKAGDILYWAEWGNPPRKVNVERGLKAWDPAYVSPDGTEPVPYDIANLSADDLTVIKAPPAFPLNVSKETQGDKDTFVSSNSYQFAYRYVYLDGEVSVLSPYSKLINYADDDGTESYNSVLVSVPVNETISSEVLRIEFLVRYGNIGVWSIFGTAFGSATFEAHNAGSPIGTYFYDDKAGSVISDAESSRQFDSVPITSKALAIARNRLFLGNNKIGYSYDSTVSMTLSTDEAGASEVTGDYLLVQFQVDDSGVPYRVLLVLINSGLSSDGYYFVTYYPPGSSTAAFAGATLPTGITLSSADKIAPDTSTVPQLYDAVEELLLNRYGVDMDVKAPLGFTPSYTNYTGPSVTVNGIGSFSGNFQKFKAGGIYQGGLIFFDKPLRNAGVMTSSSQLARIPDRTYSDVSQQYAIGFSIGAGQESKIPEWAHYYAVVRTKDLTRSFFLQHISDDIKYLKKTTGDAYDFTGATSTFSVNDTEYIAFGMGPAINDGLGYQYTEGDKLIAWSPNEASSPNRFEFPIVGQAGNYVIVEKPEDLGDTSSGDNQWMLIEIYTPRRPSTEELFYEAGENFYSVLNPGTPSRSFSVTSGAISSGDVWVKERDVSSVDLSLDDARVEVMCPDDAHWKEWSTDVGRGHVEIADPYQEHRPASITYSNQWLPGAKYNGLSSFYAFDVVDLEDRDGAIQKLVLVSRDQQFGGVMLSISESGTSSLYLGETQLLANNGEAIIASSGNVVGTINSLRGGYGTIHPETVVEDSGEVYWYDALSGDAVRYTSAGVKTISARNEERDYKMERFFRLLGPLSRGLRMPATIDRSSGAYLLYIPVSPLGIESLNDYETPKVSPHLLHGPCVLVFHISSGRWVTKYSFSPSWMESAGNKVLSWKEASLYVHDSGKNTFYGVQSPSQISFVLNEDPFSVKVPRSIAIEGTYAPDWVHIRNEHPYVQSSDLEDEDFVSKEGVYYASILRDRHSPLFESYEAALFSGDNIRGQFLQVAVEYQEYVNEITVNAVNVTYSASFGHNKITGKG